MLPPDFLTRMSHLLGSDYAAFADSYTRPFHVGLRVNTLKTTAADFNSISPFALNPVGAWEPAGFRVADGSQPGSHPYHAAGLYYMQEPSAMAVAAVADPQPGELVLDLAAAPGGKATHLAARMADDGLLVANDIHSGRARILAENLERWGARNTLITHAEPDQLAALWGPIFDKVLVDAPCSGEGMFRRHGSIDWSEEMVAACAVRQGHILDTAVSLVRPGGRLIYATCTFAPAENEATIAHFLHNHPDFTLVDVAKAADWDNGRSDWLPPNTPVADLTAAVRLWPHHFAGEGHFIAVMQRSGDSLPPLPAAHLPPPTRDEFRLWQSFARDAGLTLEIAREEMTAVNGRLYRLPSYQLPITGLHVLRAGLLLGECRRSHFRPAHHLALSLRPAERGAITNRPADHHDTAAYLSGHDIPNSGPNGWRLFTVDSFVLGWGKCVNGRFKNHYPRGLRKHQ